MPKAVEECVKGIMKDPDFKPKNKDDTKEEAAWGVCQAAHKKGKLSEDGKLPVGFAEDYLTVEESLSKDEAYKVYDSTRWALDNAIFDIMGNPDITGKKEKVLAQVESFAGILKEKFKDLNFSGLGSFVNFSGSLLDYEIVPNDDGTVSIKNLPIVQLGNHKGNKLDVNWAHMVISNFYAEKGKTGFVPPAFVSHKIPEGMVGKPVQGFIDELRLIGDVLYADLIKVPAEIVKDFPYRSVELASDDLSLTGMALLGADEIPYFKFEPTIYNDKKEGKIILTFKDQGGEEKMELSEKDKNWFTEFFSKFIPHKKEIDPEPGGKKTFTEEEVNAKLVAEKSRIEKENQAKFAEDEKKKDIGVLMKTFFTQNGKKEGTILAPRLKARVETIFSRLDNLEKIKFTEEDKTEKEGTAFNLMKEVFSEILEKPDSLVVLGEKSRFNKVPNPDDKEKFSEEEEDKVAKRATANLHLKKKKKE